ncbi:hypothetical protein RQP46_009129 [Phenoliferia psychrophenolica]
MWADVERRAPYYWTDYTEGFRLENLERVIGGTIRMYFLNLFPALAYIIDMNYRTGGHYGVNEAILASAIAALAFSVLSVQPLTIVGVTGLINLFNYTTYDILQQTGPEINYLQFQAWVLIWSAITHWLVAIFNVCDFTRFITDCTSETFGFYVGCIYVQKGVELLILEFQVSSTAGWFSVVVATVFALFVYFLERIGSLPFGPIWLRKFFTDYAFALSIVLFTVYSPGEIKDSGIEFLEITKAFAPSTDRGWVVEFWKLPVEWVFVALPFGCLVTLLFYFDNNVSAVMAQSRAFPVKRPAGFHWDFFLLGCTTLVAGILGLPAPNGLVPQAPVHTEALSETIMVPEDAVLTEDGFYNAPEGEVKEHHPSHKPMKIVRTRVVEQRISHLAMGLLTLGTMSRPLLVALGLMSRAMFAGVFIVVGWGSIEGIGVVHKTLFLLRDPRLTPPDHPLLGVKRSAVLKYVLVQWLFFAMIIAISETIAGIGFPVIITVLIPVRYYLVPRFLTADELDVLDAPTANSAAVLVSLGGPLPDTRKPDSNDIEAAVVQDEKEVSDGPRRRAARERETDEREVKDGGQRVTGIERLPIAMLDRLEVFNFKSFPGKQTLGPFKDFTAIIGPNGAGKSNLMDAISFVLGVRSATLRSAALKDLIYRSGRKRKVDKGKGKEQDGDQPNGDEDEDEPEADEDEEDADEDDAAPGDAAGDMDGERKAYVIAVYIDKTDKEWRFQRSITASGQSEYRLNGTVATYKKYNAQLEAFNILVKAKNFLVFQGDVEAVAAQSPKDLAKLIDQISGSLDLKDAYDKAAAELEKATEQSVQQHGRRKGVNGEIKQYKEMKKEAERWATLEAEKEAATIQLLLWKLYHIDQGISTHANTIADLNQQLTKLREDHSTFDEAQKGAKKDVAKAVKDAGKAEKHVKKAEKALEDGKPELVAITARITHATSKLKKAEDAKKVIDTDLVKGQTKLTELEKELAGVQKAEAGHKAELAKLAKAKGKTLSDEDMKEYHSLRNKSNTMAVAERQAVSTLVHEQKALSESLAGAQDSLEVASRKVEKLETDETSLLDRKATLSDKVKELQESLTRAKKEQAELQQRKVQTAQTEAELNEKLYECINQLQQAGADKQESDRDAKFKDTLANLKRTFPNAVKGRVIDLCKPTAQKYGLAVTTILGRNIDSVVVDSEKTAIACIEYLRVQRAGQATFIPLETIQAKPVNDKFRSFARGARLAIDVITYDASVEKAMQHACGNALVCDTMEIARHVCYDKGQEIKAVTLDGTIIHRSGLITGGNSTRAGSGRQFEEREVEGLRRREAELQAKLQEIHKNKPRANAEEKLVSEVTRLTTELTIAKDDLNGTNTRLKGVQDELKVLKKSLSQSTAAVKKMTAELDDVNEKIKTLEDTIDDAEKALFTSFCRKIKVSSIREFEDTQLKQALEDDASTLKFVTVINKLNHQIAFQTEQVNSVRSRLAQLEKTAEEARTSLASLSDERDATTAEQEAMETEIETLKETLEGLQATVAEKNAALEDVRKQGSKSGKVLDKALKEVASCNDEIERLGADRFQLYRRCKLDEIALPLEEGRLDDIPMEAQVVALEMDVDGDDDGTQKVAPVTDYGVTVDFSDLEEEEKEDGSAEMEETLQTAINTFQAEMDKTSVNRKAIDRLGDSEARFKEIDGEFEKAREAAKTAKDAFTALKKERCSLFNKAYDHISDQIDKVYKELTKGASAPTGGIAYLTLDDSEEPYLHGIKYHAMPPMKRFRDMNELSGGEKTMAALALLFAIHSFHPSPFFVLDEIDAALDNTNTSRVARYVTRLSSPEFQCLVISHKTPLFSQAKALIGLFRDGSGSKTLSLDLQVMAHTYATSKLKDTSLLKAGSYIDGEWKVGGKTFAVTDPATGKVIGEVADHGVDETKAAIAAASEAFKTWKKTTTKHRHDILLKLYKLMHDNIDDLGAIITLENGKPLGEGKGEITYAASFLEWFAEEAVRDYGDVIAAPTAGVRNIVIKQPVGVVGLVTPWNFPSAMITRKVAPALAAGCTVVIKAPPETPYSTLAFVELAERAGVPKGVINVVCTASHTKDVGLELTTNPAVRKISFTGSTPVGRLLMGQAASTIKKCSFELGGLAPFIVFGDADISAAVDGAIAAKFRNTGQTCVCTQFLLVHSSIYDTFAEQLVKKVAAFKIGNGFDAGVTHGPLIHNAGVDKVDRHVKDAVKNGAKILIGGKKAVVEGNEGGAWYEPTVLSDMAPCLISQEETFGPIAALYKFETEEEAIAMANAAEVGLAGYFYSSNLSQIWRVAEAMEVGMVGVNTGLMSSVVKQSGLGREGSKYGLQEYTNIKLIAMGGLDA